MNKQQFQLAAGISAALADRWFLPVFNTFKEFDITSPVDQAMFIAQVGHESTGFTKFSESLNYDIAGLKRTFVPPKRLTNAQAEAWGRIDGKRPADQVSIGNTVYGGRMGNTQPGDGYKYRGRGAIQITGRDTYAQCGAALNLDLINRPELLITDENAVRSAGWFWKWKNCSKASGNLIATTKLINGGTNGLSDREARYTKALKVLSA